MLFFFFVQKHWAISNLRKFGAFGNEQYSLLFIDVEQHDTRCRWLSFRYFHFEFCYYLKWCQLLLRKMIRIHFYGAFENEIFQLLNVKWNQLISIGHIFLVLIVYIVSGCCFSWYRLKYLWIGSGSVMIK